LCAAPLNGFTGINDLSGLRGLAGPSGLTGLAGPNGLTGLAGGEGLTALAGHGGPTAFTALGGVPALAAQTVTGSIAGTVVDAQGGVIPGASLTLVSESTGAVRASTSNDRGDFIFDSLIPDSYTLSVELSGFKKYEQKNVHLQPSDRLSVGRLRMELGTTSELVTVVAEGARVQTISSERSGVITSEQIEHLTVVSRDFSVLASLQPGVVYNPGAEAQSFSSSPQFNVNGGRAGQNNITIDGIPTDNSNGTGVNTFQSWDSISEVKVFTSSFQAEFGRKPGAAIQAVTKSGTLTYHGAGYWYQRNEALNALGAFNKAPGAPNPPYRFTTAGGNVGGPVYIPGLASRGQGKLFFFFSEEQQRELRPQDQRLVTVPTLLERNGDFSQSDNPYTHDPARASLPCSAPTPTRAAQTDGCFQAVDPKTGQPKLGLIPQSLIDPRMRAYLNLLPAPNHTGGGYNYQFQESLQIPKHTETARIDFVISPKTTVYSVLNHWWDDEQGFAVPAGNANWGWLTSEYNPIARTINVSATHIAGPTLLFESSFSGSRWTEGNQPQQKNLDTRNRMLTGVTLPQFRPANNPLNLVPQATFTGVNVPANPSIENRFPITGTETVLTWSGAMTKTVGSHVAKAGVFFEHWNQLKGVNGNFTGTFDFTSNNATYTTALGNTGNPYANALLGNFFSYTESTTRPPLDNRYNGLEWYVQDNWKATSRLTLDLGVRMGIAQPFHAPDGQEAGFVPSLFDPSQAVSLYTKTTAPNAALIGAIVPNSGNPLNGTVDRTLNSVYPSGLRELGGVTVAPRLGFAFDPRGQGTTAIRGGFGIFYDMRERDNFYVNLYKNPPLQLNPVVDFGNLQTLLGAGNFTFPSATSGLQRDRQIPSVIDVSLGIQREVGFKTVLDIAYVGAFGRHLLWRRNLNAIPAGTTLNPAASGVPSQFFRPYIGYGDILYSEYAGTSNYNSLQLTLNRRFAQNFQFGVAYTLSRALDYADSETNQVINAQVFGVTPQTWDYGTAGYDHTHILKGSWTWELPPAGHVREGHIRALLANWTWSGIATLQSGMPATVSLDNVTVIDATGSHNFSGTAWSGSPTQAARVDVINNTGDIRTMVIAPPAQGTLGNAPRYLFRAPWLYNWDMALFKRIPLPTDRWKLYFRAEAYNVFNRTNFTIATTSSTPPIETRARFTIDRTNGNTITQTNPAFGTFTTAAPKRRLQLALRLSF
jgi:hypothetical protein